MRALIVPIAIAALFCAGSALAQQPQLTGIWKADGPAYRDLNGSGAIIEPANGKLPYRPESLKQVAKNLATRATSDPDGKCFQPGVPRGMLMPHPIQIVQNTRAVYVIHERARAYRILYLDGSKHNDGLAFAMGDSRAHWEGATLVADVLSFSDNTWLDGAGHHHTEALHITERYTLSAPDTIAYEAKLDDPGVFTQTVTLRATLRRQPTSTELAEDECTIDAAGRRHHVSPWAGR